MNTSKFCFLKKQMAGTMVVKPRKTKWPSRPDLHCPPGLALYKHGSLHLPDETR